MMRITAVGMVLVRLLDGENTRLVYLFHFHPSGTMDECAGAYPRPLPERRGENNPYMGDAAIVMVEENEVARVRVF